MRNDLPDLMTIVEVCQYFRISRMTLWRIMKKKEIDFFRIGRRVYFCRDEILKFLEKGKNR